MTAPVGESEEAGLQSADCTGSAPTVAPQTLLWSSSQSVRKGPHVTCPQVSPRPEPGPAGPGGHVGEKKKCFLHPSDLDNISLLAR